MISYYFFVCVFLWNIHMDASVDIDYPSMYFRESGSIIFCFVLLDNLSHWAWDL